MRQVQEEVNKALLSLQLGAGLAPPALESAEHPLS